MRRLERVIRMNSYDINKYIKDLEDKVQQIISQLEGNNATV